MGIQEIMTYMGSASTGNSERAVTPGMEKKGRVSGSESDRYTVSGQARALYDADRSQRIDVVRQRIVQGFYQKKEILDDVVSGLVKDIAVFPGSTTQN